MGAADLEDAEDFFPTPSPSTSFSYSMAANQSEQRAVDEASPPEHLFSDYVEMFYLGVVILVGVSINLHVLYKLLQEKKKNSSNKSMNGYLLLKINLNISDLLILTINAFGKLIWLYDYEWRFGGALCRTFNFLSMFTLYLSSNIVMCIALDRLRTVLKARRIILMKKKRHLIRIFLATAWMLAFLWSLPQLCFWRTYDVFPNYPGGWIQCTDIWSIERYERYLKMERRSSGSIFLSDLVQNLHDITHLFFVFYGPVAVLIICYLFISIRIMRYAAAANNIAGANCAINTSMASVNTTQTDPSRSIFPKQHYVSQRSSLSNTITISMNPGTRKSIHGETATITKGLKCLQEQVHRRQSAFSNFCKTPKIPHIIYEHPTSTGPGMEDDDEAGDHQEMAATITAQNISNKQSILIEFWKEDDKKAEQPEQTKPAAAAKNTGSAQLKRKQHRLHKSLSSSYIEFKKEEEIWPSCKIITPNKLFLKKVRQQGDSRGREQSSISLTSGLKSSPRSNDRGLKGIVRRQFQDRSLSSNSFAYPEEIFSPDSASNFEVCCNDYSIPPARPLNHVAAPPKQVLRKNSERRNLSLCTPDERGAQQDEANISNRRRNNSLIQNGLIRMRRSFRMEGEQDREGVNSRNGSVPSFKLPLWRRHLKSRVFRTTLLVVLAHVLLWTPYNVYALMKYANEEMYSRMNEQANIFKDLQFLITIINPFLYGFSH